jgi:tetratricopeptide (TPR) repeat protein
MRVACLLSRLVAVGIWFLHAPQSLMAATECGSPVGHLVSMDGLVEVKAEGSSLWGAGSLQQSFCPRDTVRTGPRSRAAVMLINDAVLRLDQDTTVHLKDIVAEEGETSFLELIWGGFQSFSRSPRRLEVDTPYLNATIEGTEFLLRATGERSELTVLEGVVNARNEQGRSQVTSGQSVSARAGQGPEAFILVQPRDAVQWSLYYPPLFAPRGSAGTSGTLPGREQSGSAPRDPGFWLSEAAMLLDVGRVEEARAAISSALLIDPHSGSAHALRSMIALVQNDKTTAAVEARLAVELEPAATAPAIALSYYQQAIFDLPGARDTLLQATERQPNDALAWARLSELWLMLGERRRASETAEIAAALAPQLERVHVVRGFAALTEFRTKAARAAFEQAIILDPENPLAHFGLGLAMIRDGSLKAGRRKLEVAVGLDSSNALLRSYLGKAYFEERRDPLDADQLAIAKELDPLDPTPYLYDAIRKQAENKAGEALKDIQASIQRNDNRAVYRSRQALDQDRAARGTSLGRIYDDLGFQQLGMNEAAKSLTLDPANASAHRFLSDMYIGLRRKESARVSELLQAQLLQDININPVQPSLSETNLNIITRGGPADAGFNEFTPLFERNGVQINSSGLAGNHGTLGSETVASAIYDRFSVSAGAFHYETDGWRPKHEIEHDVYNLFLQGALSPELNVQMEFRHRESKQGDLAQNFDPDFFSPFFERVLDQDMGRVGLRYSPTPDSDVLLSFIYSDREEGQDLFPGFAASVDDEGYQAEAQYIHRGDWVSVVTGLGKTGVDSSFDITAFDRSTSELEHLHGYAYFNLHAPADVTWTLGASYDDYRENPLTVEELNPKLGVQWALNDDLLLRAAAFHTVKPALVANRTIEPTQVAGFNQLFDDGNADKAWRYGAGLDHRITPTLFVGAEATWRDLSVPVITDADNDLALDALFEPQHEQLHRAYLYWLPVPQLAVTAELAYDQFEIAQGVSTDFGGVPKDLETLSLPISTRYFHPSGFFAGAGVTFVHQELDRTVSALEGGFSEGEDNFAVVDAVIGWRFPDRRGVASLKVNNLFDEQFLYQDDSFREFRDEPSIGPYLPALQVIASVTLSF